MISDSSVLFQVSWVPNSWKQPSETLGKF